MVQITEDYAAHFYYMYINKHEGKHLTGDQIQMLCYMTCYKTSVTYYITCYITCIHNILHNMLHNVLHKQCYIKKHVLGQVAYINAKIRAARAGEPLHGVPYVKDPSDKVIQINLAACCQWCYITCYVANGVI
jgi:hypothetical protein